MTLPVAILAGGLATRLQPVIEQIPKALIDVAGKPFIVRQLELLRRHGLKRAVLCVGHLGEMVRDAVRDGSQWGMDISVVSDGLSLLGTGGAVRNARHLLGDQFFVLYGDTYLDCDYATIERAFLASGKLGLMTVLHNNNQWDRSNVFFQEGKIYLYDKQNAVPEMQHIDYGLGAFSARVFDAYPANEVIDLAEVYQELLRRHELAGFEVLQRFYEIGSPAGLEETRRYFMDRERTE
ncbi:MAG TPA: nucleotidyltransferase family protein [Nitrospirota bacterium]|nr:nucleotidyltransferase family protein [Nitrospirota bacterium]